MGIAYSDVWHKYVPRKISSSEDIHQKPHHQSCLTAPGHAPPPFCLWNCEHLKAILQVRFYITTILGLRFGPQLSESPAIILPSDSETLGQGIMQVISQWMLINTSTERQALF
jgi:hypothetical protein